jgi:TRAP-type C4-dicarboxylate transport system substrate-binding protein
MFEPLIISRAIFEKLTKEQQATIMAVGADLEKFAMESAKADDQAVAAVYQKAGAKVYDLSAATVKKWQDIAKDNAWKDYAGKNARCAKLIELAQQVVVAPEPKAEPKPAARGKKK